MYYYKVIEGGSVIAIYALSNKSDNSDFIEINLDEYNNINNTIFTKNINKPTQLDKIEANLDYLVLLNS